MSQLYQRQVKLLVVNESREPIKEVWVRNDLTSGQRKRLAVREGGFFLEPIKGVENFRMVDNDGPDFIPHSYL